MKPAPSIVGFTTVSGLGYGMLFALALGVLTGLIPSDRWLGVTGLLLALGSVTAGLLASTLHLGHPERAWRAITQWRSSWLSREGLLAIVTYIPAVIFAYGWVIEESMAGHYGIMAVLAALGAALTVYSTGMIYASLPPIKAWHQPLTAPIYLAFALMTGLLAVHLILILFGVPHLLSGVIAILAIGGAFVLKILHWRRVATERSEGPTVESATGLSTSGLVRMLDPPHTQTNYLMDEMGFQIGRKHARMLRLLTYLLGLAAPVALTVATLMLDNWLTAILALLAFASGMTGVLIERWLFFAEAEHTVMLYYGGHQEPLAKTASSGSKPKDKTAATAKPVRRRSPPARRRPNRANNPEEAVGQPADI
ncbi:MAG: DmsC/YnfH family molybdoenzyme membrane anchor subunit [Pseudomonadota bacterium]